MYRCISLAICLAAVGLTAAAESGFADESVTIIRDKMGVPHVYAESAPALFFGVGYAAAEDRLFQIETFRRLSTGQMAEIFGPEYVESDKQARIEGYTLAELRQQIEGLSDEHRSLLQASVAGINHYIQQALDDPDAKMPLEFSFLNVPLRPYDEADLLNVSVFLLRYFGGSGGRELVNLEMLDHLVTKHGQEAGRQIFNDVLTLNDLDAYTNVPSGEEAQAALPAVDTLAKQTLSPIVRSSDLLLPREIQLAYDPSRARENVARWVTAGASRSLVIGAEKSATGKPLMMQATADGYDLHVSGGGFEAAGLAMAGSLPVMGRGKDYGWLITTGENDVIDVFREELNSENPDQYRFNDAWRDFQSRTETIQVRGGDSVEVVVQRSIHGPVIARDDSANVVYSKKHAMWMQEAAGWAAGIELCRARSAADFAAAVANMPGNMNVSYADAAGRIEQWHTGRVPLRAHGVDPRLPTPGAGTHEWQGLVPFESWPHVANPAQGFLFAWNSKPHRDTTYGDSARWGKHFRTYLPTQLASGNDDVTLDDMRRFNRTIGAAWASVDLAVTTSAFFEPYVRRALQDASDEKLDIIAETMLAWDGQYADRNEDGIYDDPGLTIFRQWVTTASEMILADDLDDWWHRFDEDVYIKYRTSVLLRAIQRTDAATPMNYDFFNGQDPDTVLAATLSETATKLTSRFGSANPADWKQPIFWRYFGDVPESELDSLGYDAGSTDFISGAGVQLGHIPLKIPHNGMPSWTCIMEIGTDDRAIDSLIPTGGQCWFINRKMKPNPHLNDQTQRHRTFDYKTVHMEKPAVVADAESTTVLNFPEK